MNNISNNIYNIIKFQSYKYYTMFSGYLCRWCDIEDIINYCIMRIYENNNFDFNSNKRSYYFLVSRNYILEFLRKNIRGFKQKNIQIDYKAYGPIDIYTDDLICDINSTLNDFISLHQLIKSLSDRERFIIKLMIYGYEQKEIGTKLNITGSRISQIQKEIIKRLNNKINMEIFKNEV